jgi:nicotinamidase-related amidase
MAELQLDPKKTALVLIDLQNAVVDMNPVPHAAAQVVENPKNVPTPSAFTALPLSMSASISTTS